MAGLAATPTLSDGDEPVYPEAEDIGISQRRTTAPQRKRARHHSASQPSGSDSDVLSSPVMALKGPQRDESYYFCDGSCILRIENTLFNVHRTILSKDQSSFSTMFTLPQGELPTEGASDDSPIVLHGDTVEEFRNFLWVLYALPHELNTLRSPQADLNRLIDIARISSKYSFKSTETWALDVIQEFVDRKPSPLLSNIPLTFPFLGASPNVSSPAAIDSKAQITSLIRLAQMCNHARLLETMVTLLHQLMSISIQYAHLAMSLADELDIRHLRGIAYLEVLQRAVIVPVQSHQDIPLVEDEGQDNVDGRERVMVNPTQQLRLLSGYHRLSKVWERLRVAPPQFDHAQSCGATWHQHGCTQSWSDFWKEKTRTEGVLALGTSDVIGKLTAIVKEFDKWGSATYMHHDCRTSARRSIQDKIKQIQDSLPDYFFEGGEY
ncbi:hypothetical protein BJ138DRAFT_1161958 [Hygrophoropsis aurantiaca]|uniref:Uncharacterized protein n=1 Tax=Hygrophoropsis aurantiaca TaxID=72124 RepID=A0ACB8A0S4_9AGAM|nr:hypothetical protein BJ138DRAFT_1161958 [Hygrophoropsis aurantiaca]